MFWSCFGRVLARVESKTRPDANQDGGRGVTEAHRRISFPSARRVFRRPAGRGASQTQETKNLGTGVVETSARCRYRHHVHAPASIARGESFHSNVVCSRLLACLRVEKMSISMISGNVIIG